MFRQNGPIVRSNRSIRIAGQVNESAATGEELIAVVPDASRDQLGQVAIQVSRTVSVL